MTAHPEGSECFWPPESPALSYRRTFPRPNAFLANRAREVASPSQCLRQCQGETDRGLRSQLLPDQILVVATVDKGVHFAAVVSAEQAAALSARTEEQVGGFGHL